VRDMALIGWWPLDGNAEDYSVNRNNGTPTNVTYVNGKIGQAGSFNGTSSNIIIQNSSQLNPINISLSLWFKSDNIPGNRQLISKRTDFSVGSYWLYLEANLLFFDTFTSLGRDRWTYTLSISTNTWYHLTATYDGLQKKIYLNGILLQTINSSTPGNLVSSNGNVFIGRDNPAVATYFFSGQINDVRIYDHVLSQKEINDISKAKVLHYTFNKDEDIVYDNSGYKRSGSKQTTLQYVSNDKKLGSGSYDFVKPNHIQGPAILNTGDIFTAIGWFKIDTLVNNTLFSQGDWQAGIWCDSSIIRAHANDTSNRLIFIDHDWSSFPNKTGTWHQIGCFWDGINLGIILDGVVVKKTSSFQIANDRGPFSPMYIGGNTNVNYRHDGLINEFRMYTTALSDADILDLYQTRAKLDNQGNLYTNEFVEDYEVKSGLTLKQLFEPNKVTSLPNTVELGTFTETIGDWRYYTGNNTQYFLYTFNRSMVIGKKYYIVLMTFADRSGGQSIWVRKDDNASAQTISVSSSAGFKIDSGIAIPTSFNFTRYSKLYSSPRVSGDRYAYDTNSHYFIDLTEVFGSGNEPTKDQLDSWYNDFYKSRAKQTGQVISAEISEVDTPDQPMKIFKDKIQIQGSIKEV
jgi:hypothetical protein